MKNTKKICRVILVIYIIILFLLLDLKITEPQMVIKYFNGRVNWFGGELYLKPFEVINNYAHLASAWNDWFTLNLVGNIVLFIPVGFLIPLSKNKDGFFRTLFWGILLAVIIEAIQYIIGIGRADIDDILLYFFGLIIGAGIYYLIKKLWVKGEIRSENNK